MNGRSFLGHPACDSGTAQPGAPLTRAQLLFAEAYDLFPFFEGVVDDGAVGGAVDHLPHAALDGTGSADEVSGTTPTVRNWRL